jgi:hypothetical protein
MLYQGDFVLLNLDTDVMGYPTQLIGQIIGFFWKQNEVLIFNVTNFITPKTKLNLGFGRDIERFSGYFHLLR